MGEGDNRPLKEAVVERIGEQTIRKNAVLAVEMLLTASPEYFRPEEPERAGHYEPEKLVRAGFILSKGNNQSIQSSEWCWWSRR